MIKHEVKTNKTNSRFQTILLISESKGLFKFQYFKRNLSFVFVAKIACELMFIAQYKEDFDQTIIHYL